MAKIGETRKQRESAFMSEYWNLRKEIGTPEDNDAYWEHVVKSVDALAAKYSESPYFQFILTDCVVDLEIRARGTEEEYAKRVDENFLKTINYWRKGKGLRELAYKS